MLLEEVALPGVDHRLLLGGLLHVAVHLIQLVVLTDRLLREGRRVIYCERLENLLARFISL